MSGPYGYGGYGAGYPPQRPGYNQYNPQPGGYQQYPPGQPPRPQAQYPPGQPPRPQTQYPPGQPPRPQYPPGQPPQPGPYQGYQPPPQGYGAQPGFRQPPPQGYTPVPGTTTGYMPPMSQTPPMVTAGHVGQVSARPPLYTGPSRPAPGPPPPGLRPTVTPQVPHSFPELYIMSKEDLEKLMDNEAGLVEYFETREDIKRLQSERKVEVERNEELAAQNLALKPQLEEKQQQLIQLYGELEAKRKELNDLQQQQQALAEHYAPHNILARLKIAASEVEDESEAIAENFLNGDIAIEEFLKTFIPKKTLCHSRRAKEEKMERMGI